MPSSLPPRRWPPEAQWAAHAALALMDWVTLRFVFTSPPSSSSFPPLSPPSTASSPSLLSSVSVSRSPLDLLLFVVAFFAPQLFSQGSQKGTAGKSEMTMQHKHKEHERKPLLRVLWTPTISSDIGDSLARSVEHHVSRTMIPRILPTLLPIGSCGLLWESR